MLTAQEGILKAPSSLPGARMGLGSLSRLWRAVCVNIWGWDQQGCCRGLAVSCNRGPCQLRECRAGSVERGSLSCRLLTAPFLGKAVTDERLPVCWTKDKPTFDFIRLLCGGGLLRLMGPDFFLLWPMVGERCVLSLYPLPQCLLVAAGGQDGGLQGTHGQHSGRRRH